MSEFILGDCMDYLKKYPDGYFDLAITDPPYGGGARIIAEEPDAESSSSASTKYSLVALPTTRGGGRFDAYSKRDVFKNGRDMVDKVPDERGYL